MCPLDGQQVDPTSLGEKSKPQPSGCRPGPVGRRLKVKPGRRGRNNEFLLTKAIQNQTIEGEHVSDVGLIARGEFVVNFGNKGSNPLILFQIPLVLLGERDG